MDPIHVTDPVHVTSAGADLAVYRWGHEGVPILALHPGVGDSRIWALCAPRWAEAGCRVTAYDRRGFGASRWREEAHDDLVDLRTVTAATDCRPAILVGNSRGGGLALDMALAHPDEVLGMVLIAPSPSGFPADQWSTTEAEDDQDALIDEATRSGDLDEVNRLEIRYWLDGTEQPEGRVTGPVRDLMADMNRRALHAGPVGESADHPPVWPLVEQIDVPTLVVAGGHDLAGMTDVCGQLGERLPDARLETIDDAAHCPSLDRPDQVNALVLEFLRGPWR
jgi:pimeloyl-ACP methyl ester carboxylesterase